MSVSTKTRKGVGRDPPPPNNPKPKKSKKAARANKPRLTGLAPSDSGNSDNESVSGKSDAVDVQGVATFPVVFDNKEDDDGDGDLQMGEAGGQARDSPFRNGILIVDGVKQGQAWSVSAVRSHMLKCFPNVKCKAQFLRSGDLRVYDFDPPESIDAIRSLNWNDPNRFPEGTIPFGGSGGIRKVQVDSHPHLVVALQIDHRVTYPEFVAQFEEQGFGPCEVRFIATGKGKFFGKVRLAFERQVDADRAIDPKLGVEVGYDRRVGVLWKVDQQACRCFRCQRFFHRSHSCQYEQRCSRCAGPHDRSECRSSFINCANCGQGHQAWNPACPVAIRSRELASFQLGFSKSPPANSPAGARAAVSRSSPVVSGVSFAKAAGAGSSESDAKVADQSRLVAHGPARIDERVVSDLNENIARLTTVFSAILKVADAFARVLGVGVRVGGSEVSRSADSPSPSQGVSSSSSVSSSVLSPGVSLSSLSSVSSSSSPGSPVGGLQQLMAVLESIQQVLGAGVQGGGVSGVRRDQNGT